MLRHSNQPSVCLAVPGHFVCSHGGAHAPKLPLRDVTGEALPCDTACDATVLGSTFGYAGPAVPEDFVGSQGGAHALELPLRDVMGEALPCDTACAATVQLSTLGEAMP